MWPRVQRPEEAKWDNLGLSEAGARSHTCRKEGRFPPASSSTCTLFPRTHLGILRKQNRTTLFSLNPKDCPVLPSLWSSLPLSFEQQERRNKDLEVQLSERKFTMRLQDEANPSGLDGKIGLSWFAALIGGEEWEV